MEQEKKLMYVAIASFIILIAIIIPLGYVAQFSCPILRPLYSQPGLELVYRINYTRGNTSYIIIKAMNITTRTGSSYNVSYLLRDVSGYLTGTPGAQRLTNASFSYNENLALEEFPLNASFIPMTARVFEVEGHKVLALGFYNPQSQLIVYVSSEYGIPVYATLGYGNENMTYTLVSVGGVEGCHVWNG
jgi:hypothetical protein